VQTEQLDQEPEQDVKTDALQTCLYKNNAITYK